MKTTVPGADPEEGDEADMCTESHSGSADHVRLEDEEAPQPVDDAGHSRHQVDHRDEQALEGTTPKSVQRRVFVDEEGRRDGDRHGDDEGDQGDQRPCRRAAAAMPNFGRRGRWCCTLRWW